MVCTHETCSCLTPVHDHLAIHSCLLLFSHGTVSGVMLQQLPPSAAGQQMLPGSAHFDIGWALLRLLMLALR